MNIPAPPKAFPIATQVISDGQIIDQNLKKLNVDDRWLQQQLQKANVQSISEVFYAEVLQDGTLYIDQKEN